MIFYLLIVNAKMAVEHVNSKAELDQILSSFGGVVLVDFFATWCGPCKMLSPVLEELAEDFAGKELRIIKIDIDEAGELAAEYGITSVPTVFIGVNGKIEEGFLGANPKTFYVEKINDYLGKIAPQAA